MVKIRFHDFVLTTAQTTTSLSEERLLRIGVHFVEPWKPEQLSLGLE
jgi:DNA polymerase-4